MRFFEGAPRSGVVETSQRRGRGPSRRTFEWRVLQAGDEKVSRRAARWVDTADGLNHLLERETAVASSVRKQRELARELSVVHRIAQMPGAMVTQASQLVFRQNLEIDRVKLFCGHERPAIARHVSGGTLRPSSQDTAVRDERSDQKADGVLEG